MAEVSVFQAGGYRYIKAVFQYSGGVAAEPGYEIERARFAKPLPLADAFAAVEVHLGAIGRPTSAFAACELRSPAPFTEQGFYEFNKAYVTILERWGVYKGGDQPVNPVARTNVCPMYDKPTAPVMYAFSYTVSAKASEKSTTRGTFILAGGGSAVGRQDLHGSHRAVGRHLARGHAREGKLRGSGDGATSRIAWLYVAGRRYHAGLHGAEHRPPDR